MAYNSRGYNPDALPAHAEPEQAAQMLNNRPGSGGPPPRNHSNPTPANYNKPVPPPPQQNYGRPPPPQAAYGSQPPPSSYGSSGPPPPQQGGYDSTFAKTKSRGRGDEGVRERVLSFDLFVQACISLKRMTDVFKKYDVDRDGYITLSFEEFLTEILKQR